MVLNYLSITFTSTEVLKHSRKGKPLDKFKYRSYTDTSSLPHSKSHLKGHRLIKSGDGSKISLNNIIFLLIAAGKPQRVKQKTWRSTLMRYSSEIVGKNEKLFHLL